MILRIFALCYLKIQDRWSAASANFASEWTGPFDEISLESALGLLVVTGGLLGLTLPFGKLATVAGVPAMVWAFVISFGAGGILLCALLASGQRMRLTPHRLRYFFITAAVSYAGPNLLMFSAIPHLGAGYTGIMFTLSPVITLVFSILLRVRRPNMLGIVGIAVGFIGAVMVAVTRGEAGQPADFFWVVVGLLIPVSLAAGNIYRTVDWPEGTGPIELAVGSHLASATLLLIGILVLFGLSAFPARRCAAGRRRAGRLSLGDVCLLLPAAGGGRPGLSQPDRLCRGGRRPVCRHDLPR